MTTNKSKAVENNIDTSRRYAIGMLGAIGAIGATGIMGYSASTTTATSLSNTATTSASSIEASSYTLVPNETLATFPLATILNNSSFLRDEIHENKAGVPLTVKLKLVNVNDNLAPMSGYVHIWHCDSDGLYSGYDNNDNAGQSGKTYCRGLQHTDANGQATFATIYPGWSEERIPHINFQVFLTNPANSASLVAMSQMTFPTDISTDVYNSRLYSKGQNISAATVVGDHVFSDDVTYHLATVTGNVNDGYVAELEVGIAV